MYLFSNDFEGAFGNVTERARIVRPYCSWPSRSASIA